MENLLASIVGTEFLSIFCIGVIASLVGALFGAAGLVTLPAMLLVGIPIHTSVAVNKFATGISAFTNIMTFFVKKELVLKKIIGIMAIAFCGGGAGAYFATLLNETTMNLVAVVLLVIAFAIVLASKRYIHNFDEQEKGEKIHLAIPFIISIYDGGFGPGSASMSITYYLSKKYSYYKAVEFSRIVIFSSCFGAFLWYLYHGIIDWSIAIPMAMGSIIGSHLGLKLLPKIKMKWVQVVLPIIFLILILQVMWKLF